MYGYKGKGQISGKDGTYGKHSEHNDRNILGGRTLELLSDAREVYGCLVTTFCSSLFL
jgi:hypothetical protein